MQFGAVALLKEVKDTQSQSPSKKGCKAIAFEIGPSPFESLNRHHCEDTTLEESEEGKALPPHTNHFIKHVSNSTTRTNDNDFDSFYTHESSAMKHLRSYTSLYRIEYIEDAELLNENSLLRPSTNPSKNYTNNPTIVTDSVPSLESPLLHKYLLSSCVPKLLPISNTQEEEKRTTNGGAHPMGEHTYFKIRPPPSRHHYVKLPPTTGDVRGGEKGVLEGVHYQWT